MTTTTRADDAEAILEAAGAQRVEEPGRGSGWLLGLVRPGQTPFDALVMAWLSTYGSENTVSAYRGDVASWRTYLATLSPAPDPMLVDPAHAAGFAGWLEGRVADRTRRRRITALSSCYAFAVARRVRHDNPFAATRRPPKNETVRGPRLNAAQVTALIAAIDTSTRQHSRRDAVVARLLARCDLPVGVICAANLGDLVLAPFPLLRVEGCEERLPLDVLDAIRTYLPLRADPVPPPAGEDEDSHGQQPRDPLFYLQSPRLQGQRVSHGSRLTRDAVYTRLRCYSEYVPGLDDELRDTFTPHDLLGVLTHREPGEPG
jgi:integrase